MPRKKSTVPCSLSPRVLTVIGVFSDPLVHALTTDYQRGLGRLVAMLKAGVSPGTLSIPRFAAPGEGQCRGLKQNPRNQRVPSEAVGHASPSDPLGGFLLSGPMVGSCSDVPRLEKEEGAARPEGCATPQDLISRRATGGRLSRRAPRRGPRRPRDVRERVLEPPEGLPKRPAEPPCARIGRRRRRRNSGVVGPLVPSPLSAYGGCPGRRSPRSALRPRSSTAASRRKAGRRSHFARGAERT